jgi:hypothetical protein
MRSKLQFALIAILVLAPLVLLVLKTRQTVKQPAITRFEGKEIDPDHQVDLSKRQVFPFSVVPGGTISKEEVKAKIETDRVVREHYQGINVDKLFTFRLSKPATGYVSYRIGDKIYWTSKRLYLKAGEILLTDGVNLIRSRCGNRVSLIPSEPRLAKAEPSEELLDKPSWDGPVFQAMVREALTKEDSLPLDLPRNLIVGSPRIEMNLPGSYFAVLPPPSVLSGPLPNGGTPGNGGGGNLEPIVPQPPNPIYVTQLPSTPAIPPGIVVTPLTPVTIAYNFPPSVNFPTPPGGAPPIYLPPVPVTPGLNPPPSTPPTPLTPRTPNSPPPIVDGPPPVSQPPVSPLPPNPLTPEPPPGPNPPGPNPPGPNPPGPNPPPPAVPPGEVPPGPPSISEVPEPSTYLLVTAALIGLALHRKRR